MTEATPTHVLVVGATGSIARRVVAAAARHDLRVRALARNADRARTILPGVEVVQGDLEKPDTLTAAVQDVDAIVFTHGSTSGAYERVDYGGVANVLTVLGRRRVPVALMTSINVTRRDLGAYRDLLDWKLRSERLVRASGLPYTIVRPSWFDMTSPGDDRLVLEQGDRGSGAVTQDQVAEVVLRALLSDTALGKTFELYATAGNPPTDWDALAALTPDAPGGLHGTAPRTRTTSPSTRRTRPSARTSTAFGPDAWRREPDRALTRPEPTSRAVHRDPTSRRSSTCRSAYWARRASRSPPSGSAAWA